MKLDKIKQTHLTDVGFGDKPFTIAVYIANKPTMTEYEDISAMQAMTAGDISHIGQVCGNGWRKVFNVYSKLLYALDPESFLFSSRAATWQAYRDSFLLQQGSGTALLFSPPLLSDNHCIHIISGKTYAKALINAGELDCSLIWLDEHFAIDVANKLIVCPYFDYRQLSNIRIERLADLMKELVDDQL